MRKHQIFVYGLLAPIFGLVFLPQGHAADTFRKLKDAEIRARLAGMEVTDGVH